MISPTQEPEPRHSGQRIEAYAHQDNAFDDPRLQRVEQFVDRYPGEPLTLEQVARVACMSRTSFSRYFHQKTGRRYRDWLTEKRVRHAVALMASTDHTITRIAFDVGFQSLSTFERAFRRVEGATPSVYRRQLALERPGARASPPAPDVPSGSEQATNAEPSGPHEP